MDELEARPETRRRGRGTRGRLLAAIGWLVLGVAFEILVAVPIELLKLDWTLSIEVAVAVFMAVGVCVLGARRYLRPSAAAFREAWHLGWPIIFTSVALTMLQLVGYVQDGTHLSSNWLPMTLYYVVFCLAIGVYEECCVRGVVQMGLLSRLGGSRRGMAVAITISAVFFGCLHIDWTTLDYHGALQVAQAVLKVGQTGVYGAVLSVAVLKSQNLTGAILFHALDDFTVMVVPYALFGEALSTNYVSSGREDAIYSIVMYATLIVLYLPSLARAIRQARRLPMPQRGGFVREKDDDTGGEPPVPAGLDGAATTGGPSHAAWLEPDESTGQAPDNPWGSL
ncbi:MAG: lysostaphin resistance A-like protein [Parafannyhessea sp.]|uniref:CPBP family intramembrane glutamic endopeptidase n=1 Tax=Parafannyhessea sp. TaxID=2847324 RepID=UPI003F0C8A48